MCISADKIKFIDLETADKVEYDLPELDNVRATDVLATADAAYVGGRTGSDVWAAKVSADRADPDWVVTAPACSGAPTSFTRGSSFVQFDGILISAATGEVLQRGVRILTAGSVALTQACDSSTGPVQVVDVTGRVLHEHRTSQPLATTSTPVPTVAESTSSEPDIFPTATAAGGPEDTVEPNSHPPVETIKPSETTETNERRATPLVAAQLIDSETYYAVGSEVFDVGSGEAVWRAPDDQAVSLIVADTAVVDDGSALHLYSLPDGRQLTAEEVPAPDEDSATLFDGQRLLIANADELTAVSTTDGTTWTLPLQGGKVVPVSGGFLLTSESETRYYAGDGG